jgi:hypothetical protein
LPVPHLRRLKSVVESIEAGSRPQSWDALYSIAEPEVAV